MSTSTKTTSRGGKGAKGEKLHKMDKTDTGKGSGDKQQAGGGDNARTKDDPSIKEKVRQIVELTHRSEEEALFALHDCDNDIQNATNYLFEKQNIQDEWETTNKKKKNRQASASKGETEETAVVEDWADNSAHTEKDKSRNKSGGPPRLHGRHNDNRTWRTREKQENDRNLEEGGRPDYRGERRGRSSGSARGGGSGRGRGGGRAGGRFPPRGNRGNYNSRPIDTWDSSNTWDNSTATNANHTENNWDDLHTDEWSAEEYTGSLVETKVFTPSVQQPEPTKDIQEPKPGGMVLSNENGPQINQNMQMPPQPTQMPSQSPVPMVGSLSQAQTQYLTQLTQQTSENMKAAHQQYSNTSAQTYSSSGGQSYNAPSPQAGSQVYSSSQPYSNNPNSAYVNNSYASVNSNYGSATETVPSQQPVRTKTQRARVPPPSKIPASAVEMPGDLNSSMGFLDLQFGAMDIISDGSSFDGVTEGKFNTSGANLDNSSQAANSSVDLTTGNQNPTLDYASQKNTQSSMSSALSQSLTNTDNSIPQTSEHLPAPYSAASRSSTTGSGGGAPSQNPPTIELNKQSDSQHAYSSQSSTYNSYQSKSSSYQTQAYNNSSSTYNAAQTTSSSYVSNPGNNSYANTNAGSYSNPSSGNAYQNYSSNSSYQSSANQPGFPPMTQPNSYPNSNQNYSSQNASQSVYGANAGLNNSNYGNTAASTGQYNSYNSTNSHKMVKDSNYETNATATNSSVTTTSSLSTSSASLALTQTTSTGTKATTALAKNSSVVSNIPPGVTPVMSTPYIMGQGIPYFQQPIYSYEEMQLIQQRIPHMTAPFYEMSYQTPTTLAAVRDGGLATYSMSDGRYTRGDNNASPVPSTLSQQTSTLNQGQHQAAQPMLAQTAAGPYFFTPYSPMQPSYQFPAVYSQLPAATNAHGSSNSTQYPKPANYGSGYGSGYDALSQTQEYGKGAYVGNTQGQNKSAGVNASTTGPTGNDLATMYGKSHTALGKVNSYEKQGFHSGTPPPFTGTLHSSQNAGLAPSGTGYGVFVPTMPPHQQHHSTPLMHQPLHQMEVRLQGRRMDSGNSSAQRSQASNPAKSGAKQGYPASYWNQN